MRRSARIAALPSNATSTSTKPNRKRKAEKEQVIVPIKQLHFDGPFRQQNLPFRDSFINYITKSPSNAKAWQKLIQSCKYFFAKNEIFAIEKLCLTSDSKLKLSMNGFEKSFDFAKFPCKLWITDIFHVPFVAIRNKISSTIIPKIYRCDVKVLELLHQIISFDKFLFLSSNVEDIFLYETIVENENGSMVPLEKIVQILPKIKECWL
uniref:Uncharacterized protein n=1 Tax=Panagrolaimus davidi TaxID=227884 RepID=A0A914QPN6_9BILA